MKILYHHRIRSKDGQFVHLEELTRALADRGHELLLVGPRAIQREEFGAEAGPIDTLKEFLPRFLYELLEFGYSLPAFLRLWRAVRRFRPDVMYERYNLYFPSGAWARKLFKIPLLLEVNAPLLDERRDHGGLSLLRLARWSEEYVWRSADTVLPVTHVLARRVESTGVPPSRIAVIPNGVNLQRFEGGPSRVEAKRSLGLEGKLVLGFTGFVRDWHGLDRVIDWIAWRRDPSLQLLITGDGPAREGLEIRARQLGVASQLRITGVVAREDVARYISAYDVALQPDVVSYASPLKLFEYMACGCAIVAPARPNIREILTDGKDAVLFDPDDQGAFGRSVEQVCSNSELRDSISGNARETIRAKELTWEQNAMRVEEVISRHCSSGPMNPARVSPVSSSRGTEPT